MRRWTPILALLLILSLHAVAAACPMCKDSIPNSDAQQASNLPGGFNHSIFFMLGSFLVVGGFVVRMIVKEVRN